MELIPVSKDGDYIEIHPATLADHKRMGWLECERQAAQSDTNGNGYLSVAEIRDALDERGIEYDPKAKRPELLALLKG